jgi:hypothetical protein
MMIIAVTIAMVVVWAGQTSTATADLETVGRGRRQRLVRNQFPPEFRPRYDIFAQRCTKCHAMARPIRALNTGITPVTGGTFDEEGIRRYVVRMMRKPNSEIERADAREIILFLNFARNLAQENDRAEARGDAGGE